MAISLLPHFCKMHPNEKRIHFLLREKPGAKKELDVHFLFLVKGGAPFKDRMHLSYESPR